MVNVVFDLPDLPVGLRTVKRAEALVIHNCCGELAALNSADLVELVWALSTVLIAAQQGVRVDPDLFVAVESVAYSRSSSSVRFGSAHAGTRHS
jgi:hypothetical protein